MAKRNSAAHGRKAKQAPIRPRPRASSARAGLKKAGPATRTRPKPSRKKPKVTKAKSAQAARRRVKAVKPSRKTRAAKPAARVRKTARPPVARVKKLPPSASVKSPRLDRARRTLDDTVQTPPSSLDMDRRGSAARTGRAEMAQNRRDHQTMTPGITGGDVDVNIENAYFSGDETPGGDNQTPDQDVVDDIGRALGVEYQDSEELRSGDKVEARDRHRWELDPASAEDYKERKK